MKKISALLLFLAFTVLLNAQTEGRVIESETSNPLVGAHVVLVDKSDRIIFQTITDQMGKFSVSVESMEGIRLIVSYVGYRSYELNVGENWKGGMFEIALIKSMLPVGEVRITAFRQDKYLKDIALPVAVVSTNDIDENPSITLSDIAKNEPGLFLARDGIWATSLNIRGLSEQRIVTLVDGNRLETATDIAAGMSTIDINDIERIEVIKGAASSLYGSGALGGVVNIITRGGYYNPEYYIKGTTTLTYQSVNSMHSENASVLMGSRRWYARLSGTIRNAGNVMTPEGELENSQFSDNNLSLKIGIKPIQNHEFNLNIHRYRATNIGIPGGRPFPGSAKASYTLAGRDMISANYSLFPSGKIFREVNFKYFYQYIPREVELLPNAATIVTPSGYHSTHGGTIQGRIDPFRGHSLIAGIDLWNRNLKTERYKNVSQPVKDSVGNVIGTNHIMRAEIPIPETNFTSGGLFIQDSYRWTDKLKLSIGGRFDLIRIQNEKAIDPWYIIVNNVRNDHPANQRVTFEEGVVLNHSWSADIGLLYSIRSDISASLSLSRAFRSPSIEERFKYIDLGSTVSIGNPDLKPENGYFADFGLKLWKEKIQGTLNFFSNSMNNLIVELPGETEYTYLDQPDRVDTIPALIFGNVDQAFLYGYDLGVKYLFADRLVFSAYSSYVRGRDRKDKTNLPLMPPLNGRLGIRYESLKGFGIEMISNMAADQFKIARGETATKGYTSYDLKVYSKEFIWNFAHMKILGGIENFFNRKYVNHLTTNRGFIRYEPGRNFYLRLKLEF